MPINSPSCNISFYFVVCYIASYLNNMANFCLTKNCRFDNSNFTRAHIAQLRERFHGKEEVAGLIPAVGTITVSFLKQQNSILVSTNRLKQTVFLFQ